MALKSANAGAFTIPTAPSAGTAVSSSTAANAYSSAYVQMIASTAAAIFITAIQVSLASTSKPTYCNVQIGIGAGGSEVTSGQIQISPGGTAGATGQQIGGWVECIPWIPVANATRIAIKTADDIAAALAWNVTLQCVNQANVVDAGIIEQADVEQIAAAALGTHAAGMIPADVRDIAGSAVSTTTAQLGVNVVQVGTTAQTGRDLGASVLVGGYTSGNDDATLRGTAAAGAAGSITLPAAGVATDSYYNWQVIAILAGTGIGQARVINGYTGSTKVATVAPNWVTAPDNTSVFVILPMGRVNVGAWLETAVTAAAAGVPDVNAKNIGGTSQTGLDIAANYTAARAAKIDNLDATVSSRLTSASYTTPPTAVQNRQEMDSNSTKLANLDATVSSRSTYAGADTAGTTTLLARVTATRAGNLDNLDAAISTRMATFTLPTNFATMVIDSNGRVDLSKVLGTAINALIGGKVDTTSSIRSNTAQAGAATSITLDASASAVDNFYVGAWVFIVSGTGAGQVRLISGYVGSTQVATVSRAWATNPNATSVFVIVPSAEVQGDNTDSSGVTTLLGRVTATRAGNLDNLDAAVSTRLATSGYTVPPTVVAVRSEMDSNSTKLAHLDADVSSRLATSGYTTPPTVVQNRQEMDSNSTKLANLDAAVSSRSTYAGADTAGTTTLLARVTSTRAGNLDNLDAAVSSRSSHSVADIWNALTSGISTVGSIGKRVVDYLTGDAFVRLGAPAGASVSADIAAVKGDTAKVDVNVSTRLATSGYTAPDNADIALIKAKTDNLPVSPAATGDIPTAAQNRAEMDSNSTKLAHLDADVSTRLATSGYTAPDNTSVTAIKAKTDALPVSPAATSDIPTASQNAAATLAAAATTPIASNTKKINDITLAGTGQTDDPWVADP